MRVASFTQEGAAERHAACLAAYLREGPVLAEPATSYFERVRMVTDVAWRALTVRRGLVSRLRQVH